MDLLEACLRGESEISSHLASGESLHSLLSAFLSLEELHIPEPKLHIILLQNLELLVLSKCHSLPFLFRPMHRLLPVLDERDPRIKLEGFRGRWLRVSQL